jgi:hypothetical protein
MKTTLRIIAKATLRWLLGPPPPEKPPRRDTGRHVKPPRYGTFDGRRFRVLSHGPDGVLLRQPDAPLRKSFWVPANLVSLDPEGKELTLLP